MLCFAPFSCLTRVAARPSMNSSSRGTVAGEWSSPTSTSSKNYCITTVSASLAQSVTQVVKLNIPPPISDGKGKGEGKLLKICLSCAPPPVLVRFHFSNHILCCTPERTRSSLSFPVTQTSPRQVPMSSASSHQCISG